MWRAKIHAVIRDITEVDDAAAIICVLCEALAEASLLTGLSIEELTAMLGAQRASKLDMLARCMVNTLMANLARMERPN